MVESVTPEPDETPGTNEIFAPPESVFAKYRDVAYPYIFKGTLTTTSPICGGVPTNPKVAEAYIKAKWVAQGKTPLQTHDQILQDAVAAMMLERGLTGENGLDEAVKLVAENKHLNGFKRDRATGVLYIDGRQLKSAIKEAANVRWPKAKWGPSGKGTKNFFAEHVFVVEKQLLLTVKNAPLGVTEPSGILQKFVDSWYGSSISYEEYVDDAVISFTIRSDYVFKEEEWALLWSTGQEQGLGASRSQGYGTYAVTSWEQVI